MAATDVVAGLPDTVADMAARMDRGSGGDDESVSASQEAEWAGPYAELEQQQPQDAMDLDAAPPPPPPPTTPRDEGDVWYQPHFVEQILDVVDDKVTPQERTVMHAVFVRAAANWTRHQQRTTRKPRAPAVRDDVALDHTAWPALTEDERVVAADRVLAAHFGTQPHVTF